MASKLTVGCTKNSLPDWVNARFLFRLDASLLDQFGPGLDLLLDIGPKFIRAHGVDFKADRCQFVLDGFGAQHRHKGLVDSLQLLWRSALGGKESIPSGDVIAWDRF